MTEPPPRASKTLLVLFAVLATAISAVAYRYHSAQKAAIAHEVHNQLLAIGDMKVKHLTNWRAQKIGEARIILNSRFTLNGVEHFVAGRASAVERAMVVNWLDALCRELHYAGATLVDAHGTVVLTRGRVFGGASHLSGVAERLTSARDVTLTDLHLEPDTPPHFGLNVPLRVSPDAPLFGALLIGIDPQDYVFPLLRGWPTLSGTGESLIVRRDGNDIVFLSPLRKLPQPGPPIRIPVTATNVAAVRAVLGEEGPIQAIDYRGTPVFAAVQTVPGTSWRLVAKMDAEEVLAPLRWRSTLAGALAFSLIALAGTAVSVLWRRSEARAYRARYESEYARREAAERYEAERRAMNDELGRSVDALGASESRFRAVFEQAAVGMTLVDLDSRFLRVNQRFCDITGYTRDEILGRTYSEMTHPDDRAGDRRHVADILTGKCDTARWQKRYLRKDGQTIWIAITIAPLRIPNEPLRMLGVVEDITERMRAQEALQQSEERFRQVVEQAPEGILVTIGLEIRYANSAAVRMLGADSSASLVGTHVLGRMHTDEREISRERCMQTERGIPAPLSSRRMLRLNGETFPAEVQAVSIVYDGQPAALAFFRDVTDQNRVAEERARLEQSFQQAQKMESVGRLAGGVAHDFNNHLTVINGYCDMLLDALGPDHPMEEELSEIRAAGTRAAALTQQLLAFSRKQIAEPRPLVLNEVVEEFSRLVRRLIGDDIEVVTRMQPDLGPVLADKGQMHQVLMNLAVNARDAMPTGGRLTVSTRHADFDEASAAAQDARPGAFVVLTVEDTGTGIPPEMLQKIFEPFFTTKPMGVGTGLGLATVYGIVEQSGGWIRVASEPGRGTTFRICLPRIDRADVATASRPAASSSVGGSETVLVVEDQADVRKLAMGILRKNGYRLLEASNASDAIEVAARFAGRIDLVLTDVVMPGMTGREMAKRLQAERPSLRVLFTSGYSSDVIARQGVLEPGVAYLAKPFAPGELALKVREVLTGPVSH
jgi:PAS domain S-box-containing protein